MKKLELDASLSPLEEKELDQKGGTTFTGAFWAYRGAISRFFWGAIENPPKLPSAGDYK